MKLYHKMLYTSPWTIFKRRILTYLTKHNSHFYFDICLKISWKENIDGQQFHRYQKKQTTASHLYSPYEHSLTCCCTIHVYVVILFFSC
jgi:hypothetical protein